MAAVQDLVRWIKSRKSHHRKPKNKDENAESDSKSQKLSSRVGVALPPVPPKDLENLPDISRDCALSPVHYYDEIPAYAIDRRLDILREQHMEMKNSDCYRPQDTAPYLVVPITNRGDSSSSRNMRMNSERLPNQWDNHNTESMFRRHCSLPRDDTWRNPAPRQTDTPPRLPRRSTPWHHCPDSEVPSPSTDSIDQLDHWVSVQDNLNALSINDVRTERASHGRNRHPQSRPWYEEDVTNQQSTSQRPLHGSMDDIRAIMPAHRVVPHESWRNYKQERTVVSNEHWSTAPTQTKYPSPVTDRTDTLSDDSGVSSPSTHNFCDGHGTLTSQESGHRIPPNHYSDSDSSMYSYNQDSNTNKAWFEIDTTPIQTHCSQGFNDTNLPHHHDLSGQSSSDTYNEYDQDSCLSDQTSNHHGSMTPQEYKFYLNKIQTNHKRTCGVKDILQGKQPVESDLDETATSLWDSTQDSFDLTSVTSMSDMSMLSDLPHPDQTPKYSQRQRGVRSNDTKSHSSVSRSGTHEQNSAFTPFHRRHSYAPPSSGSQNHESTNQSRRVSSIQPTSSPVMSLEDKLSCRVTKSNPLLNVPRRGSISIHTQPSQHPVGQLPHQKSSQNKVLNDIMRINHDRQILALL